MFLEGKKNTQTNEINKQKNQTTKETNKTWWNWRKGSEVKKACYTSEIGQFGSLDACNPT